jgi:hypothetical protein
VSTKVLQAVALICDRCGATVGNDEAYRSATEARAAAYTLGWRFPANVNAKGELSASTSDACPECFPTWEPQQRCWRDKTYRRPDLVRGHAAGP